MRFYFFLPPVDFLAFFSFLAFFGLGGMPPKPMVLDARCPALRSLLKAKIGSVKNHAGDARQSFDKTRQKRED